MRPQTPLFSGWHPFTLIELIMVMVIMLVLASLVTPGLSRFGKHRAVLEEARRLITVSAWAGKEAPARGIFLELVLDDKSNSYQLRPARGWPARGFISLRHQLQKGVIMRPVINEDTAVITFSPDGTADNQAGDMLVLRDRFDTAEEVPLYWSEENQSYTLKPAEEQEF